MFEALSLGREGFVLKRPDIARRAVLAFLLSALSLADILADPAASLPSPTGSLAVGTAVEYLSDPGRPLDGFATGRPITLQLWYPARGARGSKAPYLIEAGLSEMLKREKYYGIEPAAVDGWAALRTHSTLDAPPAGGKHPLLLFSVGLGVIRANYTSIAEELASHGTIVALVESPFQGAMVLPGGREVQDREDRFAEAAGHRRGIADGSADLSLVLDRLRDGSLSAAAKRAASTVEWSRLAAAGHSSGGLVAVAACERDARLRACINMDGGIVTPDREPLADFVDRGLTKPALFLRSHPVYSDEDLAKRSLTRGQWEKRGEAGNAALADLASRSGANLTQASISPSGHFSFSDAPFVMPTAISRFGGKILAPRRSWLVVTRTLRAYLDHELAGRGGGPSSLVGEFPELTLKP